MSVTVGVILIAVGVAIILIGIFVGSEDSVAIGSIIGIVVFGIGVYSLFDVNAAGFVFIGGGFGIAIVRQKRSCNRKSVQWCLDHPSDPSCQKGKK